MTGRGDRIFNYAVLSLFAVLVIAPIGGVVARALRDDSLGQVATGGALVDRLRLTAFSRAWQVGGLGQALATSAVMATIVVVAATLLSIMAGYAFGTMRFPGATLLFALFLLGLVLPTEVLIIPLYYGLRRFHLTDTLPGVALPQVALFLSFGIFWMRAFFRSLPRSLLEAARIDGASAWSTLWRVAVPAGRPAILTLVVLFFTWAWNSYLLPLVLAPGQRVRVVSLGLTQFVGERQTDEAAQAAAAVLVSLPAVLIYLALQRHFIRGMLSGAIKA